VLLSCGLYGNVIRLLPPLTASAAIVDEGLSIIVDSLAELTVSRARSAVGA
jgi:4-aminobutyrate aminotransferase-like enzyme